LISQRLRLEELHSLAFKKEIVVLGPNPAKRKRKNISTFLLALNYGMVQNDRGARLLPKEKLLAGRIFHLALQQN
jgi:hypothetical protein